MTADSIAGGEYVRKALGGSVEGLIFGDLPGKANSRRVVSRGHSGRPMVIKSADAMAWDKHMRIVAALTWHEAPLEGDLSLTIRVWYSSMRRDLEIELLKDSLQRAGVLLNDRQIIHVDAYRLLDRERPRVEFSLVRFSERKQF